MSGFDVTTELAGDLTIQIHFNDEMFIPPGRHPRALKVTPPDPRHLRSFGVPGWTTPRGVGAESFEARRRNNGSTETGTRGSFHSPAASEVIDDGSPTTHTRKGELAVPTDPGRARHTVMGLAIAANPTRPPQLQLLARTRGITRQALDQALVWHEHHGHVYTVAGWVHVTDGGRRWHTNWHAAPAGATATVAVDTPAIRRRSGSLREYLTGHGGWQWSDQTRRDLSLGREMLSRAGRLIGAEHHRVGSRGVIALPGCTTHPISFHQTTLKLGVTRTRASLLAERLGYPEADGFTPDQVDRLRREDAALTEASGVAA